MFGRKIKVVIDFPDGEPLEYDERMNLTFTVEKTMSDSENGANKAEILISNLSNESRERIEKSAAEESSVTNNKIATVSLYAGYDKYNLIFKGNIKNVGREKNDTDINTVIYAFDTSISVPLSISIQNKSLSSVISYIAKEKGINLSIKIEDRVMNNYSFNGNFRDFLKDASNEYGFNYYVNDQTLFIYDEEKPKNASKIISRANGLIGIPKISSTGSVIQCLLSPQYGLGDLITLDASYGDFNIGDLTVVGGRLKGSDISGFNAKFSALNGDYIVRYVTHKGESRGDLFITTLESVFKPFAEIDKGAK